MNHPFRTAAGLGAACLLASFPFAQGGAPSSPRGITPLEDVELIDIGAVNLKDVQREDEMRQLQGDAPRYAIPYRVSVTPLLDGTWDDVDGETWMWRLRISAPEARSINLGFGEYFLPDRAALRIFDAHDPAVALRPFTAQDNELHGELWTPILPTDQVVLELTIPWRQVRELRLRLSQIGYGYRGFNTTPDAGRSGACNVDVVCPEGDPWRDEIPSVGVISTGGSTFCTGFLVNNTSNDGTPYFMTAYHCGVSAGNAASLVVYWNFENSWCRPPGGGASGGAGDGSLADFNTGSYFRASYSVSDFTLVELDDSPDPFNVTYSGWDRSGVDATSAVGIHHPNTDEKRISFEYQGTTTTSYLGTSPPGDGTHVRVTDWDLGTTEPGSSGSPLYDQNHHVIGQLHGGYAACGNNDSDWYGKFSRSWTGGGTSGTRLSDWLDAANTGDMTVDTLASGMSVSPSGTVVHEGPVGGPFTNPVTIYTLTNNTAAPLDYQVSLTANFGILLDGGTGPVSGTLLVGGTVDVTVTLGAAIDGLAAGVYQEDVQFADVTAGVVKLRSHVMDVGREMLYSNYLDVDPGWTTEAQWAYGTPTGNGGQYGNPDPTSGHTGPNVYGYNLAGDYANNLTEKHLTSGPIDCSDCTGVELRFWRWLNVEQPSYDHASIYVSTNGTNYTQIWTNSAEITDSSWTQVSYDISAIADGQPTVYLRWSIGPTDSSWQFSGWNIDDIEFWGYPTATAGATFRNAGSNPASYTATTLPVLGTTYTGTVDVGGTSGHTSAWLVGFSSPITVTFGGGQTLLVNTADPSGELLSQPTLAGPLAVFNIPVPNDPTLAGYTTATQALHFGGVTPWVLSNAQDLVLGY